MLVRHLLSIALLPFVDDALVPRWLMSGDDAHIAMASAPLLAARRVVVGPYRHVRNPMITGLQPRLMRPAT